MIISSISNNYLCKETCVITFGKTTLIEICVAVHIYCA